MLPRLSKHRCISSTFRACSLLNVDHLWHHQTNKYMTAPLAIAAGLTASAFGTYWALRVHFNPIKSRSFGEIMKTQMIGQCIDGQIDIKLNPLNTALQNEINETRNDTMKKIKQRFEFQFLTGSLYLRPILLDDTDNNQKDIDTVKLMKEYGICHAFWILNAGPVDYIFDFIHEGIRFEMVQNVNQIVNEYPNIYIPCFAAPVSLNIGSYKLLDWIVLQQQSQVNKQYDLSDNHCLHFVDEFGQHFKPEMFHDNNKMSKFNTGIKHKTNRELLEWTKSVIDTQK